MTYRARIAALVLLAIALLVTAAALWADNTGFGWFAYAPVPDGVAADLIVMNGRLQLALAVGALGFLLLGFAAGYGVRRAR